MKKRLALVVAVIVAIFSLGMVAFAKGNVTEMNWSDGEERVKEEGIKGKFVSLDDVAIKFWIPDDYKAVEITDEEKKEGFIAYYESKKDKGIVSVVYTDNGCKTLDEYKKELKKMSDVSEIEDCMVNDLECVGYRMKEQDSLSLSFSTDQDKILEFTFAPVTDEDDDSITVPAYIMSSIMESE